MLMKKLTSLKRAAAMLLALVMTFSTVPSSALAQEPECSCGALCTEANPDCPVCAEAPESCGYTAPAHSHDFTGEARYAYVDEACHTVSYSCTGCGEKSEPVTESHDGSCTLCVAPVPEEPQDEPEQQPKQVYPGCAHHDHDESCGGLLNACAYICQTCVEEIQAMVNALPAGDALIAADREELGAKLSAIVARYQKISDNAMAQIDFSRFDSAALMLNTPQAHFRFAVTKRYEAGVDGPAATFTLVDAITGEAAALVDESGISVTSLTVDGGSTSGTYWVEAGTYTLVENVQGAWKPQMFVNGVQDTDTTFTGTAGSSYSVELVNVLVEATWGSSGDDVWGAGSLSEAFDEADDSDSPVNYIQLQMNQTLSGTTFLVLAHDQHVTLDLNGHTITNTSSVSGTMNIASGTMTITGNGVMDQPTGSHLLVSGRNGEVHSTIYITNGTFRNSYTGSGRKFILMSSGNLVVNGGTFNDTGAGRNVYPLGLSDAGASITVNGGTFYSGTQGFAVIYPNTTLDINGGSFVKSASAAGDFAHIYYAGGTVDLTDCSPDTVTGWIIDAVAAGENTVKLPAGLRLEDEEGNPVTAMAAGKRYVIDTVPPTITAVAITPATLNLHTGDYAALTAQVSATHDDMDKSVSWQSSDTAVAVVDSTGFVKAFGVGTATITATSTVDGEKHGSCTVTVHGDGSWDYTTETLYNPQDTLVADCAAEGCNHVCKLTIQRPNNAIYDGTEKNCSVIGSRWYEVFPELSYEGPADRVNVTGQDITAYLEENGVRASVTYQVEPASVAVTVPTAKSPVYNGQEQPLLEGGSVTGASGVSILYSKDKRNWSQEIPTGKNAGEYTLYWKLDGNDNYTVTSGGENGTLSAAIAPKPFIVTAIVAPYKVYDGTTAAGDLQLTIDGLIPADYPSLDVQTTGSFATALPGTNITVTLNSVTLTGTASGNYRYDAENPNNVTTTTADIFKAEQTAPTGLVGKAETVSGKGDGSISGLTTAMEYALTESGTYSPVTDPAMAFGAGDWYIRYQETATHSASTPKKVTVSQGPKLKVILPQGYDITADITQADWHDTPRITLTIGAGFTATASFAVKANGTALVRENDTGYSYVIPAMEADVTITVEGLADITAPTVTIKVADNAVNSLLNAITFRHFFKATQRVTIDAQDAGSGVKQVQYYLSTGAVTDPNSITGWQDYNGSFNVAPDRKLVIYARVTDHRDNVTIAGSDGVVLDKTAPIINGVTDGGVYYTTQTVTATDNITGIADYVTLKLDGTAFAGTIPGNPAAAVTHTVTAENLAENVSAGIRITMKPISSLAPVNAEGEPITEENVVLADRAALENAKAAIETILNLQCGSATQAEKASLEDLLDEIDKLLDLLDQAKELIDRIEALPDPEDIEPDEKSHIETVEAVKKAYTDAVDGNEELERIIGEDYAELLEKLEKAIWDIRIVEGDGSRYTKNKSKALCFKANGPVKLELTDGRVISFQGILVDGKEVASTKYTVEAGSTLVTLKKSYLNGLKLGKHTIAFVYDLDGTEYETEEVTFRVKELNGSAATGDGSHIYLWAALAGASIAAAVSLILIHKRRKK